MIMRYKKIALVCVIFAFLFAIELYASEIKEVRHYSDKEKTRIVIQLNESVQYQTNYDKDHNLIISMPNSAIGTSKETFKINDKLVDSVMLKETDGNTLKANILLDRPAVFNVFPLESPARIVVDASPFENIIAPEVVAISEQDTEFYSPLPESDKSTNKSPITNKDPSEEAKSSLNAPELANEAASLGGNMTFIGNLFRDSGYGVVQLSFDVIILIFLVYMGIKMKESFRLIRLLKKNRKILKENPVFADMLSEMEKGHKKEDHDGQNKQEQMIEENQEDIKDSESDGNDIAFPKQYEEVQELAQRGMDSISISQESDIPVGEVNLILDLIKARKESHAS